MQSSSEDAASGFPANPSSYEGVVAMFLIDSLGHDGLEWAGGLARLCDDWSQSNQLEHTALTCEPDFHARSNVRWSRVQITSGPPLLFF